MKASRRALEAERSGSGAKALDRTPRALRLQVELGDAALRDAVVSTGARLGLEVVVGDGGRPLRIPPLGTVAHALRVEAIRQVGGAPAVITSSARAKRTLAAWTTTGRGGPTVREEASGHISLVARGHAPVDLGEPPEADAALREARARGATDTSASTVIVPEGAEERARAIVFGPSRTLSEPSSRRVLDAFGIVSPAWRLAEDAARAAVHARVVGYPVDVRVASPDTSAIDAPALAASELRTPGEVRAAFRAVLREAKRAAPAARLLGVTVARHLPPAPRLRLTLDLTTRDAPQLQIGLDDPIGSRLARPITCAPPLEPADAAAIVGRFEGRNALPADGTPRARALIELLVRLSRLGVVLADALVHAELVGVAPLPDDAGWGIGGARLRVRGVEPEPPKPAAPRTTTTPRTARSTGS